MQLSLSITYEKYESILGQPIIETYMHPEVPYQVKRIGGIYAGDSFIYLQHFEQPYHNTRHYSGSTTNLARRMQEQKRQHPLFRLDDLFFESDLPPNILFLLCPLHGKSFRRYHTFWGTLTRYLGIQDATTYKFQLMRRARRDNGVPLLMAVNRAHITRHIAAIWQASRELEFALKHQHHLSRFCPICQGIHSPF